MFPGALEIGSAGWVWGIPGVYTPCAGRRYCWGGQWCEHHGFLHQPACWFSPFPLRFPSWWLLSAQSQCQLNPVWGPASTLTQYTHCMWKPVGRCAEDSHQSPVWASRRIFIGNLYYHFFPCKTPLTMNHLLESMSVPIPQPGQNKIWDLPVSLRIPPVPEQKPEADDWGRKGISFLTQRGLQGLSVQWGRYRESASFHFPLCQQLQAPQLDKTISRERGQSDLFFGPLWKGDEVCPPRPAVSWPECLTWSSLNKPLPGEGETTM